MPYEKDRITVSIHNTDIPSHIWFGALTADSRAHWTFRMSGHAQKLSGSFYNDAPQNAPFGVLTSSHSDCPVTNVDIAQTLCAMMKGAGTLSLISSNNGMPRVFGVVRSTSLPKANAILTEAWTPLAVKMRYDMLAVPVTWVFAAYDFDNAALVFDFITWTYADIAASCAIAQVYEDLTPCDTCSLNGVKCKQVNLPPMFDTMELGRGLMNAAKSHSAGPNVGMTSVWNRTFDKIRNRLPNGLKHLSEQWLGTTCSTSADYIPDKNGQITVRVIGMANIIYDRKR